jgi:hypothetical protein
MRLFDPEALLGFGMILALVLAVLAITAPEPEGCKRTGATRSTASVIAIGPVIIPYTSQEPVYKCLRKKNSND